MLFQDFALAMPVDYTSVISEHADSAPDWMDTVYCTVHVKRKEEEKAAKC